MKESQEEAVLQMSERCESPIWQSPARIVAHIPRILTFYRNLNTRNERCDKTSYDGAPARCKVRSAPRHLGHFLNGPMLIMMDPGSGCY